MLGIRIKKCLVHLLLKKSVVKIPKSEEGTVCLPVKFKRNLLEMEEIEYLFFVQSYNCCIFMLTKKKKKMFPFVGTNPTTGFGNITLLGCSPPTLTVKALFLDLL